MSKPLEILYDSLKRENFDVPDTYDSFEKTLTASGTEGVKNRQTLYDSLKRENFDVPDTYDSFSKTLFVPVTKPENNILGNQGPLKVMRQSRKTLIEPLHQTLRSSGKY